ncbi:MAG TPA: YrzE family protein [Actinomycetota bacterium]|nr:YrzE family protein [Actinomycetota bacterium]
MARRQRTIDPVTRETIVLDGPDATSVPPADMAEYPPPETRVVRERVPEAMVIRGGFSPGAVLTGMLTAFGVMLVLSAIVGAIAANSSLDAAGLDRGEAIGLGIGAAAAFVLAQFLAYFWGGYTAGRMARGKGVLHGLLVPVFAAVVAGITALIVAALGSSMRIVMPFGDGRFSIDADTVYTFGAAVGIAALAAMVLGGMAGGMAGTRWHTKLERKAARERYYDEASDEAS